MNPTEQSPDLCWWGTGGQWSSTWNKAETALDNLALQEAKESCHSWHMGVPVEVNYCFSDCLWKQLSVRRRDEPRQPGRHRHPPSNVYHALPKSILLRGHKRINNRCKATFVWCKATSPLWQPGLSRQFSFTHVWMGTVTSSHHHTVLFVVQHGLHGGHQVLTKQVPPRKYLQQSTNLPLLSPAWQ